jgi:hypothetical protein
MKLFFIKSVFFGLQAKENLAMWEGNALYHCMTERSRKYLDLRDEMRGTFGNSFRGNFLIYTGHLVIFN